MQNRILLTATVALAALAATPVNAQSRTIQFGDDTSTWANDGECDDPRFEGSGMASSVDVVDTAKDATDCLGLYQRGQIRLRADYVEFGGNSSTWANDGECDDPRFRGPGMASSLDASDRNRDANDCRALYRVGQVELSQPNLIRRPVASARPNISSPPEPRSKQNQASQGNQANQRIQNGQQVLNFTQSTSMMRDIVANREDDVKSYAVQANSTMVIDLYLCTGTVTIDVNGDGDTDVDYTVFDGQGVLVHSDSELHDDMFVVLNTQASRGSCETVRLEAQNLGNVFNNVTITLTDN